ncbi:mechanosensitive ion channel domain-containing protein [Cupriavidus sp. AcVe19-1a]|uniref:mechanosensitive ion channel family protein n=1 Tax=Cupriavidus sp. AcVe19-1a TaxID=2821359 RepID=UPI001AE439AC|nr:mechanosensitive ion channel domain-containing protein [Cupriavidus sp. AcVe19-1a]MBP0627862.1 mechanosensitive ion channel [Cupriavidus sp. AcVe19-1a]
MAALAAWWRQIAILWTLALPCLPAWAATLATAPAPAPAPVPIAVPSGEVAELRLMDRPIAMLRAAIGGATPAMRVARAQQLFDGLTEAELVQPLGQLSGTLGDAPMIAFRLGDRLLFALAVQDLSPEDNLTLEDAGAQAAAALRQAIAARRAHLHWPTLMRGAALSLLGLGVLATLAWGVSRASVTLRTRLRTALQRHVALHLERRAGQFDWTGTLYQLVARLVQIVAVGVVLVLAFAWLEFALEQFPLTQPMGDRMGVFILHLLSGIALSMVGAVPGLVTVVVILLITRAVQRLVSNIFKAVQKGQISVPGLHAETAGATRRLAAALIWVLGFTFAYPYIPGSESDVFKGLSVLLGFMVTLGSANVVNQLMSGMVVVYSRALRRGDMVCIGDTVGTVASLDALSVKVINLRNEEVTLPNAVVVGSAIHNYTRHGSVRDAGTKEGWQAAMISTSVTIGYDTPWRQVHAMLLAAAAQAGHVAASPTPFVLQRGLSDFYVEYELFAALDDPRNRFYALSALHAAIQDQFNTHGVQIMSPHFMAQPEKTVYVPEAKWFEQPGSAQIDPAARPHRAPSRAA